MIEVKNVSKLEDGTPVRNINCLSAVFKPGPKLIVASFNSNSHSHEFYKYEVTGTSDELVTIFNFCNLLTEAQ